jgi:acetyl-CoA synthetase
MNIQLFGVAIVGFPHDIKGNAWLCYSKETGETRNKENLYKEINQHISDHIDQSLS